MSNNTQSNVATRQNEAWLTPIPIFFVFLWSTGFIVAKFGLPFAPPLTFLLLRCIGVLLVLVPLVLLFKAPWPKGNVGHIAIAGLLLQAGYLGGVWCAIKLGMPAGVTALIVGMQPILTAAAAPLIGETVRPPIVQLKNGVWTINENINPRETLLKPFITDHFNEALNSSKYSFFLRSSVRRTVRKKACGEWRAAFPALTQTDFADISQKLKLWHGEDYGFSESENFVTIADTCFD